MLPHTLLWTLAMLLALFDSNSAAPIPDYTLYKRSSYDLIAQASSKSMQNLWDSLMESTTDRVSLFPLEDEDEIGDCTVVSVNMPSLYDNSSDQLAEVFAVNDGLPAINLRAV